MCVRHSLSLHDALPLSEIFEIIQKSSGADDKEMYQVFNMGCRLEIYTEENTAEEIIKIAQRFNIDAQIIGRVETSANKERSEEHTSELQSPCKLVCRLL